MGGYYGSIHIRTADCEHVCAAVAALNCTTKRFLIAPPINGWVTVFPEDSGMDPSVSRDLSAALPDLMLIHGAVADDDVFLYWLYDKGTLKDSYNSDHGYLARKRRQAKSPGWKCKSL